MAHRYKAVLFDLLSALVDSWSLRNDIAGDPAAGLRWRAEYLRVTYRTGAYRDYEDLAAEAAEAASLPRSLAAELAQRFGEVQPWPEASQTLRALAEAGVPLGVVTNCSERLGRIAAGRLGVEFATVVTSERAGFYKPDPRPYLLALGELDVAPEQCLFVAGSAFDLFGTARVGLPTYWHNRIGLTAPEGAPLPLYQERTLDPLLPLVLRAGV